MAACLVEVEVVVVVEVEALCQELDQVMEVEAGQDMKVAVATKKVVVAEEEVVEDLALVTGQVMERATGQEMAETTMVCHEIKVNYIFLYICKCI